MPSRSATETTVNPNIIEMEYAVRGPIPARAAEMKRQGRRVILCNIGNPQALGQKPLTYLRQVLSLVEDPGRLERERQLQALAAPGVPALAAELLDQAQTIVDKMESGMGAYTESRGPAFIREAIARFIDRRDGVVPGQGVPADPDHIFLTNGASEGVKYILEMLIAGPKDGIMVPIPQYPLYSAAIKKLGGNQVNYYPDEEADWNLEPAMLEEALVRAQGAGVQVKAIVVINPGNPTGAILSERSQREVIEFAAKNGLAIIADEVYQENVYDGSFTSFARLVGDDPIPLFSLHSISKGFFGECGHRGGYLEVRNAPRIANSKHTFIDLLVKQASVSLCSNTVGQVLTYLMVTPPREGSAVHLQMQAERKQILEELYEKALTIKRAFTKMEGMRCYGRIGALYLFPKMEQLPAGTSDFDYCMNLLEETGICTVNGQGFGQKSGTHHLRIAFLPPQNLLNEVLPEWIAFHNRYVNP
ncbi:MAG TPA: aminotransferase class I/II-fold pyridoxal phosphate-dependent enzyme [bacterium]|nr:aminotransferase class I/II-fold pyridoxal phosphate-dependent enzyme [bacterium]HQG44420.1 aminotransferase class I/II-fold pyridoxal phosphate-dependent enzyme [bacterium]HQI47720.1 aminotransferase class I/II-fold pyridoxal phosphate-dependent enzyme [bacterium]HQJ64081.1 aminotransferase class I/II-fold pyridoxal phosphate-dependent enzyme [bacterium]